jgi:hypothetical protein
LRADWDLATESKGGGESGLREISLNELKWVSARVGLPAEGREGQSGAAHSDEYIIIVCINSLSCKFQGPFREACVLDYTAPLFKGERVKPGIRGARRLGYKQQNRPGSSGRFCLRNAFGHGVSAWRTVARFALSNFVLIPLRRRHI